MMGCVRLCVMKLCVGGILFDVRNRGGVDWHNQELEVLVFGRVFCLKGIGSCELQLRF
jgi:hypothetical protein